MKKLSNFFSNLLNSNKTIDLEDNKSIVTIAGSVEGKNKFDDLNYVISKGTLEQIKIFGAKGYVTGLMAIYRIDGVLQTVGNHSGTVEAEEERTLFLTQNEKIVAISLSVGYWIDKIGFYTNKENHVEIGGKGGKETVYKLPEDFSITAFGGTTDEYLNSLTIYYGK
jgi:hypothetical protein